MKNTKQSKLVSLERPAQRATCIIDQLESRTYCAFGRLDSSWGTNGELNLRDLTGDLGIVGVIMQPDGKIVVGFVDPKGQVIIKRRLRNGSLDRSFGKNGELTPIGFQSAEGNFGLDPLRDGTLRLTAYAESQPGDDFPRDNLVAQISPDGRGISYVDPDKLSPVDLDRKSGAQKTYYSNNDVSELLKRNFNTFIVLDVIDQGQFDLVAFRTDTQVGIARVNKGTGRIDTSFAKSNSQNHDGIYFLPDQDDMWPEFHALSDGSIIYTHDIYTGMNNSLQIGHLTRDGEVDRSIGTANNKYRVDFLASGNNFLWQGGLIVGANDQVYVTFSVDENGSVDRPNYIRIYRLNMPVSPLGRITGKIFNDLNLDGKQQSNEKSITGRRVFIDENRNGFFDSGEWSVITNENGDFVFNNVLAGTYNVRRVLPAGYKVTSSVFSMGSTTVTSGKTTIANIGSVKV